MNRTLKYILLATGAAVIAVCICCSFMAGRQLRSTYTCQGLEVTIKDSLENSFVSAADVKAYLDREYGIYKGIPLDSLDMVRIESIIDGRSAVKKSQAYVTRDGILHIDVTQRKPVVRFQKAGGGFYADKEGYIFPLQKSYASHVQIIDGNIPLAANSGYKGELQNDREKKWFKDMMELINFMEDSRTWKDKIVQIHVNGNRDLILIPREGNEHINFGQPDNIEEKFAKLEKYYTSIIPAQGNGRYTKVDLRYRGQIVCR